jgi:hypothetical protein
MAPKCLHAKIRKWRANWDWGASCVKDVSVPSRLSKQRGLTQREKVAQLALSKEALHGTRYYQEQLIRASAPLGAKFVWAVQNKHYVNALYVLTLKFSVHSRFPQPLRLMTHEKHTKNEANQQSFNLKIN